MRCQASSCGRSLRSGTRRKKRPRNDFNHSQLSDLTGVRNMSIAKAEILDAISNMTVLELSQLIKEMEDKFGVSAAAATVAVAAPAGGGAGAAAAAEEKTEFTVMLNNS